MVVRVEMSQSLPNLEKAETEVHDHGTENSPNGGGNNESSSDSIERKDAQSGEIIGPPQVVDVFSPEAFPDGGRDAWVCVAGSSAAFFCSWGWINCVGVFQDYYQRGPLQDLPTSTVAWIVSFEVFFMLFAGPFVGVIFDSYGPRWLLIVGTVAHVFGLMMASISTEFYQILLSQGIISAIGASMIFNPSISCMATWFYKKRGLAMGMTAAGSSIGGVLFPIIVSRIIPLVGFGWALRICAFLVLALMTFANLAIKSRIPPKKRKVKLFDFVKPWTETSFILVGVGTTLYMWGFFLPIAFIVRDATANGMGLVASQYLVSYLNAGSFVGRIIPGIIGDRFGRINTMILMSLFTTILVLAFWIPARSDAAFIAFSALVGISTGAGISLPPAIIAQISDISQIGVRSGACFGVASVASLTGSPIGGALMRGENDHGLRMKLFSGLMCFGGAIVFIAARLWIGGLHLRKRL